MLPFFFKERKSQLFLIKNWNTQSKGGDAGDYGYCEGGEVGMGFGFCIKSIAKINLPFLENKICGKMLPSSVSLTPPPKRAK